MVIFQSEDRSEAAKSIPDVIVYDNSNIQKSCNGVTTPLTYNFTRRVYSAVYKKTLSSLLISNNPALKNDDIFQNLVGLIKGRIYYNINNWYLGFQFFHSLNQTKSGLSQMMGLSEPVSFTDDDAKDWKTKCVLLWVKCVDMPRLMITFKSLKFKAPKFLSQMQACCTAFYQKDFAAVQLRELKKRKEKLDKDLLSFWNTPIVNDLYVLMICGDIAEKLTKSGLPNPEEFVNSFLIEEQSIASMQPAKQLHELAIQAAYYPELKFLINRLPDDIHEQIEAQYKDFYKEVNKFINCYGDRTTGELKLETSTMRQNPIVFYGYLRECLRAQISEIRARSQTQQLAFKTLGLKLSHLPFLQKEKILSKITKLQTAVAHREQFKLERSRVFGMYRTLYRAFGVLFQKNNWIENADDIFYLTEEEILSCENGNEKIFSTLIATRKQEFKAYEGQNVPSRVLVSTTIINAIIKESTNVAIIQSFDSKEIKAEVA